jgi:hypothetical protein
MQISTKIAQAVETHLETMLDADLAEYGLDDYEIKLGRLQADPERPAINLMVHIGKPRDTKWVDEAAGSRYVRSAGAGSWDMIAASLWQSEKLVGGEHGCVVLQ